MRYRIAFAAGLLVLAVGLQAQSASEQKPPLLGRGPTPAPTPIEPLDIWQIDLNPSGTGFALTTPVDQGDVYVFKVWPDRAVIRLPKTRVKKMVRRTKDVSDEVLYRIDLLPTGEMFAREEPTLKGTTYVFHSWREGTFMSVRQTDVQKVTRVAGIEAFKIHLQQLGAQAIGNLPMEGGGTVKVIPDTSANAQANAPSPSQDQGPSNWIYQGVPGVTDAWAPPSAIVAKPGDVPRAPN
jgi:hypothetical protein